MNEENNQQQFQCTGDCLKCRAINDRRLQWQYCAAQFTYNSMRMLQSMQESISAMSGSIEELKVKLNAIQDNEAMVFSPTDSSVPSVAVTQQPSPSPDPESVPDGSPIDSPLSPPTP